MPSETSSFNRKGFFNATLFRKNLTRFWPIWGLYAAILFFLLPANLLLTVGEGWAVPQLEEAAADLVASAILASVPLAVVFGLITAMALFSYLMNSQATQLFHALPIQREGLFLTNWLSALWFFLAPSLVVFLITLAVEAALGVLSPGPLLLWLLVQTAASMFFFCFAACCAMFTGHILALPVFYGILNILVLGMTQLAETAFTTLLIGYGGSIFLSSSAIRWATPVYQLAYLLEEGLRRHGEELYCAPRDAAAFLAYCLILGALFTLIALAAYRRRQLERAGDLITVGWVRPVFQSGFGICLGFVVGIILYYNYFNRFGPWAYIVTVALCVLLAAFAGRMLLKKTLKVFREGWKGCAALACCIFLLLTGAKSDLFGFQRWTPDSASVKSVTIQGLHTSPYDSASYTSLVLTDPQLISQVVDLHASITGRLDEIGAARGSYYHFIETDDNGFETNIFTSLSLRYTLSNGKSVFRSYSFVPLLAQDLDQPDTPTARLSALLNQPQLILQSYLRALGQDFDELDVRATGGWLSGPLADRREESPQFTPDEAQLLWDAFQEDLANGRIKRYLFEDRDRNENCYYTDLTLTLNWNTPDKDGVLVSNTLDLQITPEKSSSALLSTLEELGLKDLLVERTSSGEPSFPDTDPMAAGAASTDFAVTEAAEAN